MPIDVDVRVDPHAALEVSANATAPSLESVRRLRAVGMNVSGEGTLRAYGALFEGELTSRATLDTHRLEVAKLTIGTAHLEASLNGPLRDLEGLGLRLAGHLRDVRAGALVANDVLLAVHGTPKDLEVTVGERGGSFDVIALAAHVTPGAYTLVTRFSARLEKAGYSAFVSGASLGIGEDVMDLGSVRVEGLGAPIEAELHWSPRCASPGSTHLPSISRG